MGSILDDGTEAEDAADGMAEGQPGRAGAWLEGVTTLDGGGRAAAVKGIWASEADSAGRRAQGRAGRTAPRAREPRPETAPWSG